MNYLLTLGLCLILNLTLVIIFFTKKSILSGETTIYKALIITNLIGIVLEMFCIYLSNEYLNTFVSTIVMKFYFSYIITYITLLLFYEYEIYQNDTNKLLYKKFKKFSFVAYFVSIIILLFLPIEQHKGYATGVSIDFIYLYCSIVFIIFLTIFFFNRKTVKFYKVFPLLLLGVLMLILTYIQKYNPELTISTVIHFFTVFIMYHTIENPDLNMLNEYVKNRELTEINIQEKTNTLFKISEDVKSPIRKINLLSNKISKSDELTEIHTDAKNIDIISNNVLNTINDVLDISLMDKQKIKTISSTYNIYNLFNQIVYIIKSRIEGVNTFKYSISNALPEKIYGDSTKLKQIVCSIILNSYKISKKGIIDLDMSSIIKNNVCRLVITIQDTGTYLSLDKINELLDSDYELDKNMMVDELDIDLKTTKKIIDILGGTIFIKSDENNGTTYTVVINQIIESTNNESVEPLTKFLSNKKRAMVVDDNYKELEVIANELKRNNYEVISTMYGKDCIDRIDNDEKYDLIFVNDEMQGYNAVKVISELDLEKIKQTKVIVMLDKNKEFIKEHYLEDYPFSDYLLKSSLKDEIERIKNKY